MASELVGVISDTHGLLRPEAVSALEGCHCIIHAGDIGKPEVLEQLRELAPVYAVRGNVDSGSWARALPAQRELEVRGKRLYVLHDVSELDFEPATRGYAAVISGHSHQPRQELREGVLYLNPGSAGPRRFKLPIALARLRVGRALEVEMLTLEPQDRS